MNTNNKNPSSRDMYANNPSSGMKNPQGNLSHATTFIGGDIAAKMTTYRRAYAGTLDEDIENIMRGGGLSSKMYEETYHL
jgi:hypothetical protein